MAETWIFGYGSLIFRQGFEVEEKVVGAVDGFERRFWQASSDHRGTPESPGRVVTLVEKSGAQCSGVAFRIPEAQKEEILAELEVREQGGYRVEELPFKPAQGKGPHHVRVYIGREDNPHYIGPESEEETAAVIRESVGPSGHNTEYLIRLAEVLMELEIQDEHVIRLANLIIDPDGAFEDG